MGVCFSLLFYYDFSRITNIDIVRGVLGFLAQGEYFMFNFTIKKGGR
jgi:hypothetical protein